METHGSWPVTAETNRFTTRNLPRNCSRSLRQVESLWRHGITKRILSLDGSTSLAPLPFQVGQPLTRRPKNSGSVVATYTRGRVTADATGYFRGKTLYEEQRYGANDGLFWSPGFAN